MRIAKTYSKPISGNLIGDIRSLIETARHNVAVTVNAGLTILYPDTPSPESHSFSRGWMRLRFLVHGQRANNGLIQGFQRARIIMIEGNCIESCSGKMGYSLFKIWHQFSNFAHDRTPETRIAGAEASQSGWIGAEMDRGQNRKMKPYPKI